MKYIFYYIFKNQKGLVTLLAFSLTLVTSSYSQTLPNNNLNDSLKNNYEQVSVKKSNISFEVTTSILPKAKITTLEGYYRLKSQLQSSYDLGINYLHRLNKNITLSAGLHFTLGKLNLFLNVPNQDLQQYNIIDGRRIIESKDLWGAFRLPILVEKKIKVKNKSQFSIKSGIALRYSGFMTDLRIDGGGILDSNNNVIQLFSGTFSGSNNFRPWITLLIGGNKFLNLKNRNVISFGLQADISRSYFYKGNYEITIPNQAITTGSYKINGTSIGLSVQYIFTGTNKQIINRLRRKEHANVFSNKTQKTYFSKNTVLSKFVFWGNHIQFNFSTLSVFKARLKNQTGNYPVNSKASLGLSIGFKYQKNFNNSYSLVIGPDASILGRNFITSFNKNDFSPPLTADYNLKGISSYSSALVLSLPVLIERRWLYCNTKHLFINGGLRLNFSAGADFDGFSILLKNTANGFYDVGGTDVYANNDAKPWISFPVNAGHSWLLKNNNLLQLSISSDISFTKFVNGTHMINIPGRPLTTGQYSSTGSYIGLSMNYVFTNANYRIRKAYEKTL